MTRNAAWIVRSIFVGIALGVWADVVRHFGFSLTVAIIGAYAIGGLHIWFASAGQ